MPAEPHPRVLVADVREAPLSLDEVVEAVREATCGGLVTFVGMVRDHDHGKAVDGLGYSAHPLATEQLAAVCTRVANAHSTARVGAVHRVGQLAGGDLAVVGAGPGPHRGVALPPCRELIDTLKHEVPIWKHQVFADGEDEWVGIA